MRAKLFVAIAVMLAQVAIGQKVDEQELADYQTNLMIERLDLSEAQKLKVKEHNIKYSKKQAALMNSEGSMFGQMGDIKKIKEEKNAELKTILDKEQLEIFEDEIEPGIRKHMQKKIMG